MSSLLSNLASMIDPKAAPTHRNAHDTLASEQSRTRQIIDRYERHIAELVSALLLERAAFEARRHHAAESEADARPPSAGKLVVVYVFALLGLPCEVAMNLAVGARYAGIPVSELGGASPLELAPAFALAMLALCASSLLGMAGAMGALERNPAWALGAGSGMILLNGALAYLRSAPLVGAAQVAEFVLFTLVPTAVGLLLPLFLARHRHEREPLARARRTRQTAEAEIRRLEARATRAWQERTLAAAALDGVPADALPFIPTRDVTVSGPSLPAPVTTGLVIVGLLVLSLLFAGCGGNATTHAPLALGIVGDTSPSMTLDVGGVVTDVLDAAAEAHVLRGGAELWVYRTTKDGEVKALARETVPRRFPNQGDAEQAKATWLSALSQRVGALDWDEESDSSILRSLSELGQAFDGLDADRKVVVLVSDCRDYMPGHHFFETRVPDPERLVADLRAAGALPNLPGVEIFACGLGTHPTAKGTRFTQKQQADVVSAMQAVAAAGGGTFRVLPSCERADLARVFSPPPSPQEHDHVR